MKKVKIAVLAIACLAMLISMAPLVAVDEQDYTPGGSGGGSGATWRVTCNYNGYEQLVSKSCSSGGNQTCSCP